MAKLLDILLHRSDIDIPWGFSIYGGTDLGCHAYISSVTFGTLAARYMAAGDRVLQIERLNAETLRLTEIQRLLDRPGRSLQLVVQKTPQPRRLPLEVPEVDVNLHIEYKHTSYDDGKRIPKNQNSNQKRMQVLSEAASRGIWDAVDFSSR